MDSILGFVRKYPIATGGIGVVVIVALVAYIYITRYFRNSITPGYIKIIREGFDGESTVSYGLPDGRTPEVPFFSDHCPIIAKALGVYGDLEKKFNEKDSQVNKEAAKKAQAIIQNMYDKLNCAEYLEKLERGEITAGKTPLSERPEDLFPSEALNHHFPKGASKASAAS